MAADVCARMSRVVCHLPLSLVWDPTSLGIVRVMGVIALTRRRLAHSATWLAIVPATRLPQDNSAPQVVRELAHLLR